MPANAPTRASLPGTRPAGTNEEGAAARQVREMFSRIAPRYDLLNHLLSLNLDVAWRRRLAKRLRRVLSERETRVLDLCCGTGDLAFSLCGELERSGESAIGRIFGADFAHPMLMRAREKASGPARGSAVQFLEADALHLPFPGETFDVITTAFGFRNLANYEAGVRELRRVLRPGGILAILDFAEPQGAFFGSIYRLYFRHVLPRIGGLVSGNAQAYGYLPSSVSRFPPPSELAALLGRAGFRDVAFERWTGGAVALHTARR